MLAEVAYDRYRIWGMPGPMTVEGLTVTLMMAGRSVCIDAWP